MSAGKKVIHVELFKTGKSYYFGSIAAIYDKFDTSDLGICQKSLYDYVVTPDNPYLGKKCNIRSGKLNRKKGNRRKPGNRSQAIFSI